MHLCTCGALLITESVDSVCRDGTDMPYVQQEVKLIGRANSEL